MDDNKTNNTNENNEKMKAVPVDGTAIVEVSDDNLSAFLTITEEQYNGKEITRDDIVQEIDRRKVVYNIDMSVVDDMLDRKRYNRRILIAKGFLPINGLDGSVEYLFETNNDLTPKKGKFGEVDYKNLGLVRNITRGELIAKIKPPTNGTDGMTVFGAPLPATPGKEAKVGVGAGTELSEDGLEIRASIDGNLNWQKDRFVVDETLVIKESVDVGTGNIDFIGNIVIKGEIKENFTVKSLKNITISGSAIGATIIADGDVIITLGSINSDIVAQGSVKLGFCENSKIECQGDFSSQTIIGSDIFCGGTISATNGKGVVVGGKYTALVGFNANIIGSDAYVKTRVTLGNGAVLTEEKLELEEKIRDLEDRIKKLLQVAEILQEHKKNFGQLSADREAMLTTSIRSRFTFQREIKQLNDRIKEIDIELEGTQDQFVIARKEIFPGVIVRINTELLIVDQHFTHIMIGKNHEGHLAFLPLTK